VPRYVDAPPSGRWVYRVVVVSGTPPPAEDAIEVSTPSIVTVG
jgi:hypothetical protein